MTISALQLAALGLRPIILSIYADDARCVMIRTTFANQFVARAVSCTLVGFSFSECCRLLEADPAGSSIVVFGNTAEHAARNAVRFVPAPNDSKLSSITSARPEYRRIFLSHLGETGEFIREQFGFKVPEPLPPALARIRARIGDNGYEILAAQSVFSSSCAPCRVVSQSMLDYRKLSRRTRDDLAKIQLAWNIIAQAFIAIENLAAMYESLRSTRGGDYTKFAETFLRFGYTDKVLGQHTVHNTFQRLGSPTGAKDLAQTFGVPLHRGDLKRYGLADCDIDPDKLVAIGKLTQAALIERFNRLGLLVIFDQGSRQGQVYNPMKARAKKAYDALHHGFTHVLPVLAPYVQMISLYGGFIDDEEFGKNVRRRDFAGMMMTLDPQDGSIETISVPSTIAELKRFAHAVFVATKWVHEMAKYAHDKFASPGGQMPYLINSSVHLSSNEYGSLQARLRELRG